MCPADTIAEVTSARIAAEQIGQSLQSHMGSAVAGRATVRYVSSSPALDADQSYLEELPNPRPVDAKTGQRILAMIEDLRKEIPGAVGGDQEVRVASKTKIFLVDSNDSRLTMDSYTIQSDDGAALGILKLTPPALALLDTDPAAFKFAAAHEQSHHLFKMNPGLVDNPRLNPASTAYNEETSRIDYGEALYTPKKIDEMIERSRNEHTREGKPFTAEDEIRIIELAEMRKITFNEREKAYYKEELTADTLGLRLSKDDKGAERLLDMLAKQKKPVEDADHAIALSGSPHPSVPVRLAELRIVAEDMRIATQKLPPVTSEKTEILTSMPAEPPKRAMTRN